MIAPLRWLTAWRRLGSKSDLQGELQAIYVSHAAGEPMVSCRQVEAIVATGLQGDRYCSGSGFWRVTDACQVTLITTGQLRRVSRRADEALTEALNAGSHRRNLVIEGLSERQLSGRRFRIGGAVFLYSKPRPPCGYIDQVAGSGTCKALGRDSGACIEVQQGGLITVGDRVELLSCQ